MSNCSVSVQQDLREECIKLKMLVFDLERQNRALCELFQQKLPNHPTAHYQVTNSVSSLFRQKNTEYGTRNNRVYEISVAALYFCCRLHKA